ncbi:MAG: tetratricopeptide repeat protein [Anaerolineae bacterium]|nr:tetratricopeptide repeat protein [Anaerolineae bacterium]
MQADGIAAQLVEAQEAVHRLRRYIPPIVAEGILHDKERLRGERREVTVLFADAVEFTHLSASLDAESVFNLINDLLGRLMACIQRYDGMVDKFTGDGLMAVFGAPIAHESDPELAVRAALDMQKAAAEFESIAQAQLGAPLKIRIGIHSGPAIAGILGTERQCAYTVIGETVNLAARLEALARPGHILVSARVYNQTRALFDFQSMGTSHIKGVDQPVMIYEAIGERADPLPTRGVAGVSGIFLGRDAEFDQLRAALNAFLSDAYGRVAIVEGEAGMGKSRLVSEGLSAAAQQGVTIWRGHGLPYAQGVGYGIFRSLLQDAFHNRPAAEAELDALVTPSLRPFLMQVLGGLSPEEAQAAFRNLEPELIKQLTTLAMREWLLGEASQRPVILILDDFHWADDLSRDLLYALINVTQDAAVFICVITRPMPDKPLDLVLPLPLVPLEVPAFLHLKLNPLSPEHSRALLAHLVDVSDLPEQLIETILARAQGNPFYIEEFVRMLIEKDILKLGDRRWQVASVVQLETVEVPATLNGMMMARVDRLPEDLRLILSSAAVIGLQFSAHLLEEVERRLHGSGNVLPAIERLSDLGLLVQRVEAGRHVYAFRHIITQETIYNSLLRSRRPDLHRTVGECIEHIYAAELDNYVEVLALHYDRARVREKALHYMLQAGQRAMDRFANREAIEYYSRALQLSQHLSGYEAERWNAAIGLGQVEQHIGEYDEAIACYRAALDDWAGATFEAKAQVMLKMGQVWDKRGNLEEAEGWQRQALFQLDRVEAAVPELRAQVYSEIGWLTLRRGDLNKAQEWLEKGLALVQGTEHYRVLSSILNRLGGVHFYRGDYTHAATCVEQSLDVRQRQGDLVGYARSLNNLAQLKWASGDWDGALENYELAVERLEQIGEIEGLAQATTNLGVLYTDRGEWSKAEENLKRSFDIFQRVAYPYELAQTHMNLGRLYLLQGRWDASQHHLTTAIPMYAEAGARANVNLIDARYLLGRLYVAQGQLDAAEEQAGLCYELLENATGPDEKESIEWGRHEQLIGRIAQARGDLEAARQHLEHSATIFRERGSQLETGRAAYWNGLLALQMGQPQKALRELNEARLIFHQLGAMADLRLAEEQLAQMA